MKIQLSKVYRVIGTIDLSLSPQANTTRISLIGSAHSVEIIPAKIQSAHDPLINDVIVGVRVLGVAYDNFGKSEAYKLNNGFTVYVDSTMLVEYQVPNGWGEG